MRAMYEDLADIDPVLAAKWGLAFALLRAHAAAFAQQLSLRALLIFGVSAGLTIVAGQVGLTSSLAEVYAAHTLALIWCFGVSRLDFP